MDDDDQPVLTAGDEARHEEARYRHLDEDLRDLIADGLAYAAAEAQFQKARAIHAAGRLKWIVLLGISAATLAFFALVALTVGLVIALTPLIGAIGATLAVFGGLVLIALVCALTAVGIWKRMIRVLSNPEGS